MVLLKNISNENVPVSVVRKTDSDANLRHEISFWLFRKLTIAYFLFHIEKLAEKEGVIYCMVCMAAPSWIFLP